MTHLATSRRTLRIVAIAAATVLSAACGYKGPLYLPPPPNAPSGNAASPTPAAAPATPTAPAATAVPVLPSPGTATLPNDPNTLE